MSPNWLRPLGIAVRLAAAPSIVYVAVCSRSGRFLPPYVQAPLQNLLTSVPFLSGLVSGPPVGIGILSADVIPTRP
jgi:phosphate transport system permease protein